MDLELVFEEKITQYPNLILCEEREQEETVDLIIPDSYPDGAQVLQAYGTPLIYSMEISGDTAVISGEIQGGVLYEGMEGQLRCVKARVPFSFRRELQERGEKLRLNCSCSLLSADARLLNSRKLLLRVNVNCSLRVYGNREFRSYEMPDPAPVLQLKRTELPLQLPVSLGEKRFSLQEELPLPRELPEAVHLLKTCYGMTVTEQKAVGDKAVFKGELHISCLWESEEEQLLSHRWSVPFSQYATMDRDIEDCQLCTQLCLLSADTQPDSHDGSRLLCAVEICAQTMATGISKQVLIEDAYCTDGELEPTYVQQKLTACLDRQQFRETAELRSEIKAESILSAYVYPGKALRRRTDGERVHLEQTICCDLLYYDEQQHLCNCSLKTPVELDIPLQENASCRIEQILCGEGQCSLLGGEIVVRVPVELTVESSAEHSLKVVSGGEIKPSEATGKRPSLILRFTEEAEELWEIAKSCKTSQTAIREANELTGETVPANTLLLIPM